MNKVFFISLSLIFSLVLKSAPSLIATASYNGIALADTEDFKLKNEGMFEESNFTPLYMSFLDPGQPNVFVVGNQNHFKLFLESGVISSEEMSSTPRSALLVRNNQSPLIVLGLDNGAIEVFDALGKKLKTLPNLNHGRIHCLSAYMKDNKKYLLAGTEENFIDTFDFDTGELLNSFRAFSTKAWVLNMVVFSYNDEIRIVATGLDIITKNRGLLGSWSSSGKRFYQKKVVDTNDPAEPNSGYVYGIALYKDGAQAYLAVTANDPQNIIKIYDPIAGNVAKELELSANDLMWSTETMAIREDNVIKLIVGYMDGMLRKWNTETHEMEQEIYANPDAKKRDSKLLRGMLMFGSHHQSYVLPAGTYVNMGCYPINNLASNIQIYIGNKNQLLVLAHQQQLLEDRNFFANSNTNITLGSLVPFINFDNFSIISITHAKEEQGFCSSLYEGL